MQGRAKVAVRSCIAICFSMLLLSAAAHAAASASGRSSAELEGYVDGVVSAVMTEHRIPGLVISVVGEGRILLSKGYGVADEASGRPPDPASTLFRIGSVTKTFTWIAIMQLVEQGQIDLHADVNHYLGELRIAPWHGRPLTLHDIMAHRAGFEETRARFLFEPDPDQVVQFRQWLRLHAPRRVRAPGEAVAYSNYAATLAGLIVENASGMPFHEYLDARIFEPLGMSSTTILEPTGKPLIGGPHVVPPLDGGRASRFSTGFVRRNGISSAYGFEFISGIAPAGAGSSTADDMGRYMLGLLEDGEAENPRLLRPGTFVKMRERSYPGDERATGFASGFLNGQANGQEYWGHGGITTTFSTTMLVWPELEFGVFVSINQRDGAGAISRIPLLIQEHWHSETAGAVVGGDARTRPPAPALAPPEHGICCLDGYYLTNRRAYTTLEKFDYLRRGFARVRTADNGSLLLTKGTDATRWLPLSPLVFTNAQTGAVMTFEADADGRVLRFNEAGGYDSLEKMPFVATPRFLRIVLSFAALFALVMLIFAARQPRREPGRKRAPDYAAAGLSAAMLLSVGLFAAASGAQSFAPGWPPATLLAGVWLSNCVPVLATTLFVVTVLHWHRLGVPSRSLFFVFACVGIAMTVVLDGWNLVGLPSY